MPTILTRIFLICNLLLYLVPKKLRPFFLPSSLSPRCRHHRHHINTATAGESGRRPHRAMDPTELRRVFQMFDHNGDGRITKKELSDSLENLGIFIPGEELEDMIGRVDANGDGCVDIDEFEALYGLIMVERGGEEEEEDMKDAFGVFDLNGDGFITVEELRAVLGSMGLKQGKTLEDCRRMIKQVDVDGDGRVNYKEFKQMMKRGGFSALG